MVIRWSVSVSFEQRQQLKTNLCGNMVNHGATFDGFNRSLLSCVISFLLTVPVRYSVPVPVTPAGEDAVASLLENTGSVRRLVDVGGDFINARQRMQHLHVRSGTVQIAGTQRTNCVLSRWRIRTGPDALFVRGSCRDIDLRHYLFDSAIQAPGDTFSFSISRMYCCGMASASGAMEVKRLPSNFASAWVREVDGAAIFQVTTMAICRLSRRPCVSLNGKQIQQRLGGMLVGTVAGVQYRHVTGELGCQTRGTFLRMTHHDNVDIGADDGNELSARFRLLPSDVLLLSETHRAGARRCMEVSKG